MTLATAREIRHSTATTLAALLEEEGDTVELDLSGVASRSSLVLSLMLCWLRQARQADRRLEFRGVPADLHELIRFTGLDGVLPLASRT